MKLTQKTIDTIANELAQFVFELFGLYVNEPEKVKDRSDELYQAFKEIDDATVTWPQMGYVLSMLVSNNFEEDEEGKVSIKFGEVPYV
jgi:hypothetical protein